MQIHRWLSRLRPFLTTPSSSPKHSPCFHHRLLSLHSSSASSFPLNSPIFTSLQSTQFLQKPRLGFQSTPPLSLFQLNQVRHVSKAKEKRLKRLTPAVSKLKKYKIKPYSSFKSRFRTMNDGKIRRWHAGKRHNAHLKSKISKRRLRLPALVHPAYAKVMKKLNFSG